MSYNLGKAEGKIVIDGSGASKGFNVAGAAANGFFGVIQGKLDSVKQLGQNMLKVGATTSAGLAVAVNAASSFEERLSAIRAVSGATASEMDQISKAALRIGKDTSFSATEAASAMEELVKAGISTKDILNGAADATVALAAAGEIALPQAAEIASAAMNNFNLTGKDMPKVADLIAGAANASAISVGEFGMSLQQSGAVANLAGLSFDDLSVAIAEMGNAGIKGSDAGTSIKTFLSNLIPTTDRQVSLFKKLGIVTKEGGNQFFDAAGKVKSMADIQEILAKATKGMSEEQKLANLEVMFGSDAIRAAAVFAGEGAKGYNEMAASMGKVTAAEVAKTRLDNLNGSIEEFKGSIETAMITIGSVFLPVVRKIVDGVTAMVNIFNNLPESVQKGIAVFLGIIAVISTLIGGIITLSLALAPLIAHFVAMFVLKQVGSIVLVAARAMMSGSGAAGVYSAAMSRASFVVNRFIKIGRVFIFVAKMMRTAWLIMTGPIGIAIAAILALVAIGKVLYDRWEPFHDLVNRIASAIKNKFNKAMTEMHRWVQMVIAGFQGFKSADGGFYEFLFKVGAVAKKAWDALQRLGSIFMTSVLPALKEAGGSIAQAFLRAWNDISNAFRSQLIPALKDLWGILKTELLPSLNELWVSIKPLVMQLLKFAAVAGVVILKALLKLAIILVQYVLPAVIKFAAFLISLLAPAITVIVQALIFVITWLVKFVTFLVVVISAAISGLAAGITAAMEWVKQAWQTAWNKIKEIASAIWAGILLAIRTAIGFVKSIITTGMNILRAVWSAFWSTFGPIITAVWNLIVAIVQLGIASVAAAIRVTVRVIKAVWNTVWNWMVNFLTPIFSAIKTAVMVAIAFVAAVIKKTTSAIRSAWNTSWNAVKSVASSVWGKIRSIVSSGISKVKSFVSSGINTIKNAWSNGWKALDSATGGRISSLKNRIKSAISSIKGFFKGAGSWLVSAGKAIIQGLINGIGSLAGKVTDKIASITNKIKNITNKVMEIHSPSKVFYRIGAYMLSGWLNGIKANAPRLYTYMKKLANRIADMKVSKARKNYVSDLVANYTSSLSKLNKTLDTVQSKLKDAKQKYKDLVAEAKSYAKALSQTIQGGITDITAKEGTVLTADDIMTDLRDRAKYAETFYNNLKKLKAAGLDKEYLQQITEAGAEAGGATAMALVANLDSIATVNSLQNRLAKVGNKVGSFASTNFKKAGIDAAKGIIAGLESQDSKLQKSITKLAKKMVAALKKALKIKSPSKATFSVGTDTIQGMINGLDDRRRKLESVAESVGVGTLAAIAGAQKKIDISKVGSLSLGATSPTGTSTDGSAGSNTYLTQNIYNPVAERSSETTNKELQKLTTMGVI